MQQTNSTGPSFTETAQRHLDGVRRYLVQMVRHPHLADDLTSETFERAFRQWSTYDPAKGPPLPWLLTIARRIALDHFRSERRRREREERYSASVAAASEDRTRGYRPPPTRRGFGRSRTSARDVALRVLLDVDGATTARWSASPRRAHTCGRDPARKGSGMMRDPPDRLTIDGRGTRRTRARRCTRRRTARPHPASGLHDRSALRAGRAPTGGRTSVAPLAPRRRTGTRRLIVVLVAVAVIPRGGSTTPRLQLRGHRVGSAAERFQCGALVGSGRAGDPAGDPAVARGAGGLRDRRRRTKRHNRDGNRPPGVSGSGGV